MDHEPGHPEEMAGADGSRTPSVSDLADARYQGEHVPRIAGKLAMG